MRRNLFSIISIIILVYGCQSSKTVYPDCGIDAAHMNKEIQSGLMDEWNSYKKWDGTGYFIRGEEQLPIYLPGNLNLKVFFLDTETQTWNQIRNKTIIHGDGLEVLDKDNNIAVRTISLDLPNSQEPVKVFYCISGETINGEQVGASGRFILNP